jgi:hypothetical protein
MSKKSPNFKHFCATQKININAVNKLYHTNNLGIVYGPYGYIGFVGAAEVSCEVFRYMRYYKRRLCRATKKAIAKFL